MAISRTVRVSARAGSWRRVLLSERRTAAVRRTGRPRDRAVPRGRWPSPARPQTARRAAISPACCMRRAADDGQAAHGRPGQQRPIRPLAASLASSCPISSPWPAAAGGGSGRMSRPSGRRPSLCDQCGSTAATEPRRGRAGALVDGNALVLLLLPKLKVTCKVLETPIYTPRLKP